jgi:hypothetical protein
MAFMGCENLKVISLESLVNISEDYDSTFFNCRQLQTVILPVNPPLTFNYNTFKNTNKHDGVNSITLIVDNIEIYDNNVNTQGDVANDGKFCQVILTEKNGVSITIDGTSSFGNTIIEAAYTAYGGSNVGFVHSLSIDNGTLISSDLLQIKSTFPKLEELIIISNCSLNDLTIPEDFMSGHQYIQSIKLKLFIETIKTNAFSNCPLLSEIVVENANILESLCFASLPLITKFTLSTVVKLTGCDFFSYNPQLTTIILTSLTTVEATGPITQNTPSLTEVYLPEANPTISSSFIFDNSPEAKIPSNSACVVYDDADTIRDRKYYTLRLNYYLVTAVIDGELKAGYTLKSLITDQTKTVEVRDGILLESDLMFSQFSTLKTFTISEAVSITVIPNNAFSGLVSLKEVTIKSTTAFDIASGAFNGCNSLVTLSLDNAKSLATSSLMLLQ